MKAKMSRALWEWFGKNGRHGLPWRQTHDPYKIVVSEVMLQQTQVSRVLIKYGEFLKQFPSVTALASSSLGDTLRAWSGLGYNRRAKHLWECARVVVEKYHGKFPEDFDTLQELPGIGRSTAAALMSFAFGVAEPMIDTNIRRMLVRIFFQNKAPSDDVIYQFAKTLIPKGRGREWNWAMMDVGALACTAKRHDDAQCPFQKLHGPVKDFQYKKPQKKFKESNRYYRGQIIKRLMATAGGCEKNKLARSLGIAEAKCGKILDVLQAEQLIIVKNLRVRLP